MIFKGVEICCPYCKGALNEPHEGSLVCMSCDRRYPVIFGIPDLRVFPDPYIDLEADRSKGLQVAARFDELSFAELVSFYYSITSGVPANHARQYTRGLMAGLARAEAALAAWETRVGHPAANGLLDVGCGTAPLLAAAAGRYQGLVGVDIAFRWLVVGKKRLAEAGVDVPLICACAEALPFPAGSFDRVVGDSVLEHVKDQQEALGECYRVMKPGSFLFVSTPNRYSLGPDPQVGIWAGGYLPNRLLAWYVKRQGGIPPKRRLLSAGSLSRLIRESGFCSPQVMLPDVPRGQRNHFKRGIRLLIDVYQIARRLPMSRHLLRVIGPLLHAVSQKPLAAGGLHP
jgi:SAM-dependent methyltransferase